jgi:hypothetical protein
MNDEYVLGAVRDRLDGVRQSLGAVHMDRPAQEIIGRARARRLRRGLSGAAAGGTALGVSLALALSGPAAAPSVHINLDAWSVNTTKSGVVDVTIRELDHPAELRQALAKAGVPTVVTFGKYCTATKTLRQIGDVLNPAPQHARDVELSINPAAMPKGSKLSINVLRAVPERAGHAVGFVSVWALLPANAHLSCGTPPVITRVGNGHGTGTLAHPEG